MLTPTQLSRLANELNYDAESGTLFWKQYKRGRRRSLQAGYEMDLGHISLTFERKRILAHHLIWYMVHGQLPTDEINHIDGDPSNNRMNNLRLSRDVYSDLVILVGAA